MKQLLLLATIATICQSNLEVVSPESLKSSFVSNSTPGSITYTVSTFGNIPYTDKEYIKIMAPQKNNESGCENLEKPKNDLDIGKFAWLVERGDCTYSKKAFIAQQSGAYISLVYHNQSNIDVTAVIPCADSVCKLKRQQPSDPNHSYFSRRRVEN